MKNTILATLCLLCSFTFAESQTYINTISRQTITVTEGETTPISVAIGYTTMDTTPFSFIPPSTFLYQLRWDLDSSQPWATLYEPKSGVFLSPFTAFSNMTTMLIYPGSLTVPAGMDQKIYSVSITGAAGPPIYVIVKKASTGGGSSLSWSVSPTSTTVNVPGTTFTKAITITNNSSQTLNWSASENSSELRLSRTSGSLGPNSMASLYVYGTVYSNGSGTVRISDQTGSAKTVSLSWRRFAFKKGSQQFVDSAFNSAVMAFDLNQDGILDEAERLSVTELRLNDLGIEDLTGIDAFPNLVYLDVSGNILTELPDLQPLEKLLMLKANDNFLETLPTQLPTQLKFVEMRGNAF